MKILTIGCIAAATLALAACGGGDDPTTSASPDTSSTPTIAAEGPTSTPEPSLGNSDDPLCAAALKNIEDAADLEAKVGELQTLVQDADFLTKDDPTVLNEWGDELLILVTSGQDFYKVGITETEGDDVNAYFVTMNDFVETYSKALALSASEAKSNMDFVNDLTDAVHRPRLHKGQQRGTGRGTGNRGLPHRTLRHLGTRLTDVGGLTPSTQDYLKAVWSLGEWNPTEVTVTKLAERLGVRTSTASDGLKKLAEQGFVEHAPVWRHRLDAIRDGSCARDGASPPPARDLPRERAWILVGRGPRRGRIARTCGERHLHRAN